MTKTATEEIKEVTLSAASGNHWSVIVMSCSGPDFSRSRKYGYDNLEKSY